MTAQSFCLKPFPSSGPFPDVRIGGSVFRYADLLAVSYRVDGCLEELAIPSPVLFPARRNELWQQTCFELFLAAKHAPGYWEFNISPAGHWNVYRFSGYRQGMQEERAFKKLPLKILPGREHLCLTYELPLKSMVEPGQAVEAGVCAVIMDRSGKITYWALNHSGPRADFHRRDGFVVEV